MLHAMSEVISSSKLQTQVSLCSRLFLSTSGIILSCHVVREFDENLLQRIPEVFYEDDVQSLPHPVDVSNYLMAEVAAWNNM